MILEGSFLMVINSILCVQSNLKHVYFETLKYIWSLPLRCVLLTENGVQYKGVGRMMEVNMKVWESRVAWPYR